MPPSHGVRQWGMRSNYQLLSFCIRNSWLSCGLVLRHGMKNCGVVRAISWEIVDNRFQPQQTEEAPKSLVLQFLEHCSNFLM